MTSMIPGTIMEAAAIPPVPMAAAATHLVRTVAITRPARVQDLVQVLMEARNQALTIILVMSIIVEANRPNCCNMPAQP